MKNVNLILVLIFLLQGCAIKEPIAKDQGVIDSDIKQFKMVFFMNCITRGDSKLAYDLFKDDLSLSHDFSLGIENYRVLDSLAMWVNVQIDQDSIRWTNKICPKCPPTEIQNMMDEGMIGRRTLEFCLDYYTSRELDSIAVIRISRNE